MATSNYKNTELKFDGGKTESTVTRHDGKKYILEWLDDVDFSKLVNVKQAYGYIFDENGKLLIVNPGTTWRLPGGGPEDIDKNYEETLIRETIEEADAIIKDIQPLGYLKVTPVGEDNDEDVHYALRYVARLKQLDEQTIDEAVGIINERLLIDPDKFSDYCDWGEMGLHVRKGNRWSRPCRACRSGGRHTSPEGNG